MSKNIISIIPARMGSSRFPGKPMAPICGIPMVGHVYKRVKMSTTLNEVYVATCDTEIYDYITSIGGKAVMTSDCHERCSDRCAEAMLKIEQMEGRSCDIMVMVQGDEPLTFPGMIDEAVAPMLKDSSIRITNLVADINTIDEFADPNEVKVVVSPQGKALYFSREPIPSVKKIGLSSLDQIAGMSVEEAKKAHPKMPASFVPKKQVCIIPFTRDFLLEYNAMTPTPLEVIESVDMMRIIENGMDVIMVPTAFETKAVDTPADLAVVDAVMEKDPLYQTYKATV